MAVIWLDNKEGGKLSNVFVLRMEFMEREAELARLRQARIAARRASTRSAS